MPEAKSWLQPLYEVKDVAFSLARWIPPTTPRISPLPRRYLRLSFVLSFRSSFRMAVFAPAQRRNAPFRAIPRFRGRVGSFHSSRLSAGAGLSGHGSSPSPAVPSTARRSGYKGARNAREPATNPCSATGASGSHLRSFASQRKWTAGGANRKCVPEQGRSTRKPDMGTRFPLEEPGLSPAFIVSGTHQTAVSPWHWEPMPRHGHKMSTTPDRIVVVRLCIRPEFPFGTFGANQKQGMVPAARTLPTMPTASRGSWR